MNDKSEQTAIEQVIDILEGYSVASADRILYTTMSKIKEASVVRKPVAIENPKPGSKYNAYADWVVDHASKNAPDFEILSFKYDAGAFKGTLSLNISGKYVPDSPIIDGSFTLDSLLQMENASIHSVKRLSDGTVFTVGDRVAVHYVPFTITEFEIAHGQLYAKNEIGGGVISAIEHVKTESFVTKDIPVHEKFSHEIIEKIRNSTSDAEARRLISLHING